MSQQVKEDKVISNRFLPFMEGHIKDGLIFAQDADRSGAVADLTVLALNANNKLVVLDDATKIDNTQIPYGLLDGSIPEADIKAADVTGVRVIRKVKWVNEDKIVVEGSLTINTYVNVALINAVHGEPMTLTYRTARIRDLLEDMGILMRKQQAAIGSF